MKMIIFLLTIVFLWVSNALANPFFPLMAGSVPVVAAPDTEFEITGATFYAVTPAGYSFTGTQNTNYGARKYNTLNAAVTALPSTLTTPCVINILGDWTSTADTTAVTVDGKTTTAANYIMIRAVKNGGARCTGVWDATKYRLSVTTLGSQGGVIDIRRSFVRIDGIQISYATNSNSGDGGIIIRNNNAENNGRFYISNCLITRSTALTSGYCNGIMWDYSGTGDILYAYNNMIYGYPSGIRIAVNQTAYIYNNTIANFTINEYTGIANEAGTVYAVNNIMYNGTNAASGTFAAGTDYNVTNNASMGYTVTGGGNSHDHTNHTFTFVSTTSGSENFHLQSSDTGAKDLGVSNPGSGLYSTDIDDQTRSGLWDCGADEY